MFSCPLCLSSHTGFLAQVKQRTYLRCDECQLIFASPDQRLEPTRERERYLEHNNDPLDSGYRKFLTCLSDQLIPRLQPGTTGLDYGSGPGPTLSVMLEEQGFDMSIYDPYFAPDPSVLKRKYDFVTCTEVIEHFYNPAAEFARLDLLLKPGGLLGIMTQMVMSEQRFKKWRYLDDPTHVCFYHRDTMNWIAGKFRWSVSFPAASITLFCKL